MQSRDVAVTAVVRQPHQVPLRPPSTHLTLQVAVGFAEIAKPNGARIDAVQVDEHPDQ